MKEPPVGAALSFARFDSPTDSIRLHESSLKGGWRSHPPSNIPPIPRAPLAATAWDLWAVCSSLGRLRLLIMHRSELSHWLDGYLPTTGDEQTSLDRFRELLVVPGDIFSRSHFSPGHVTASAVVLNGAGDRIALIKHTKLQKWLQPGGHVEPGDTSLTSAVLREVVEECGPIELETAGLFDIDVHPIPPLGFEPAHLHFDVRLLCRVVGGEVADTGEVDEVMWFSLEDPPDPIGSSVARLIAKARTLL